MQKEKKFTILDNLKINIEVTENPFDFNMDDLFEMGARINPKRSFLFISKLLGKHLEVKPNVPKIAGYLLANKLCEVEGMPRFSNILTLINNIKGIDYNSDIDLELKKYTKLPEPTLFIGFAETATGLGHAVASAFSNGYYVHTTREEFSDSKSIFDFEEEHSHATGHLCYLENDSILEQASHIVLIDDEITTGKTCINLIKSIDKKYPGKRFTVLTLLDWRKEEHEEEYEKFYMQYGISVTVESLLRGKIEVIKDYKFNEINEEIIETDISDFKTISKKLPPKILMDKECKALVRRLIHTGRFGIRFEDSQDLEEMCQEVGEYLIGFKEGKKTLCIGDGELIYIPSRIASYMGDNVWFKSSTRSPIYVDDSYIIHDRISYTNHKGVTNYIYNLKNSDYDEVFMFFEDIPPKKLLDDISRGFHSKGINKVKFVFL